MKYKALIAAAFVFAFSVSGNAYADYADGKVWDSGGLLYSGNEDDLYSNDIQTSGETAASEFQNEEGAASDAVLQQWDYTYSEIYTEESTESYAEPDGEYTSQQASGALEDISKPQPEVFFNEELGGYGVRNYEGEMNYDMPSEDFAPYAERVSACNQFIKTKITIMIGTIPFTLTQEQKARCIAGINTDEPYVDKEAVWNISNNLCKLYNHYHDEPFYTSNGKYIHFTCGDYGWSVDFTGLTDDLISALSSKTDTVLSYKPYNTNYNVPKPGMTSDIGPNYVEVDISLQKIWVYRDNKLVLEDDCVTGKAGNPTPTGIWSLKCNQGRTELIGDTWDVWVDYWMFFHAGCGLHDAKWQRSFGLARWQAGYGSHGCVNLKAETAKKLHDILRVGEPIIVYASDSI